jgi:hypothetical protein
MQEELINNMKKNPQDIDLGFILWKLETIQDFVPAIKTIMRNNEE